MIGTAFATRVAVLCLVTATAALAFSNGVDLARRNCTTLHTSPTHHAAK